MSTSPFLSLSVFLLNLNLKKLEELKFILRKIDIFITLHLSKLWYFSNLKNVINHKYNKNIFHYLLNNTVLKLQ